MLKLKFIDFDLIDKEKLGNHPVISLSSGKSARSSRKRASSESALTPVYKEFERGNKFWPNGIEAGVNKIVLRAFQRKPRASAVSSKSLAAGNML